MSVKEWMINKLISILANIHAFLWVIYIIITGEDPDEEPKKRKK